MLDTSLIIPGMKNRFTSVRVTTETREIIRQIAQAEDRDLTTVLTRLVRAEWERQPKDIPREREPVKPQREPETHERDTTEPRADGEGR
jgi:hypothetical protein